MTDNRPIRTAVIGCGHWGPNLARNVRDDQRSELVALCDLSTDTLERMRSRYPGVPTTTDASSLIQSDDVDAMVISTPATTHYALAKDALLAGKHVLLEKPVSTDVAEAKELAELAGQVGRVLLTGHIFLYNRAVRYLRDHIWGEGFGDVLYMHARRTNLGPVREDVHAGWDLAAHDISMFIYLLGKVPVEVTASAQQYVRKGNHDVIFATLYFEGGAVAHVHASWLDPQKVRDLTVVGTNQMVVFDDMNLLEPVRIHHKTIKWASPQPVIDTFGSFRVELLQGDVVIPRVSTGEPLRAEVTDFFDCIVEGREPASGGALGRDVVRVLCAMDRSIAQGSARVTV
jgi:predicted dehydrogenase